MVLNCLVNFGVDVRDVEASCGMYMSEPEELSKLMTMVLEIFNLKKTDLSEIARTLFDDKPPFKASLLLT